MPAPAVVDSFDRLIADMREEADEPFWGLELLADRLEKLVTDEFGSLDPGALDDDTPIFRELMNRGGGPDAAEVPADEAG